MDCRVKPGNDDVGAIATVRRARFGAIFALPRPENPEKNSTIRGV
jgi:hypothetical protein